MQRRTFVMLLGGAAGWPLSARAQQKAMPVVGYLFSGASNEQNIIAFREGLGKAGYVEGRNVGFEFRMAGGSYDRLPALAADLVDRKVDVIVAVSGPSALAAKAATKTIPVVFLGGDDPVAAGLIDSLSHPGGNLTGVSFLVV